MHPGSVLRREHKTRLRQTHDAARPGFRSSGNWFSFEPLDVHDSNRVTIGVKRIFLCNPKGGCGKTMIATQLAGYFASIGLTVAIADHDRQRSSLDWLRQRPGNCPEIRGVAAYRKESVPQDVDVVVHDLPASLEYSDLEAIVSGEGTLIVPLLPSPTDLMAGVRFLMLLNADDWSDKGLRIGIVANRVRQITRYHKVLLGFVEKINRPLIGTLRDTQNYIRSSEAGVSLFDLPAGRFRKDLAQWQPIIDWIGKR